MNNNQKNTTEYWIAGILLVIILIFGATNLPSKMHFGRLIIGLTIGYTLARSSYGFAGIINRSYNTGSTRLMRSFMLLIIMSSFVTMVMSAVPANEINPEFAVNYGYFVHPINVGTFVGSFMFGVGMALAGGCASGVLTDLTVNFSKAIISLFFFGAGLFASIPLGKKFPSLINQSIIKTGEKNGVWFPDLFKFDGFNGFLGAFILTLILCLIVIKLSYDYENKRKSENTYTPIPSEEESRSEFIRMYKGEMTLYEMIFTRPWTLLEGALGMTLAYVALMGVTRNAWGVSGPFGFWFAKIISIFVGKEAILSYVGNPNYLDNSIISHAVSLQDLGIISGAFIALLSMGRLCPSFKEGLKIDGKQALMGVVGGLLMGLSIGISKGCNAGGLFSPIVGFSLSGWIFLVFMGIGGVVGNKIVSSIEK